MKAKEIYPVTIVADRYGGTYTGGKYLAFNSFAESECVSDDYETSDYLIDKESPDFPNRCYGVGDTPNEALEDLATRLGQNKP